MAIDIVLMTKIEAKQLAKQRGYVAKPIKGTRNWGVWCVASDHWVEFDQQTISASATPED